ncbi:MAG: ABC transporter permease [Anaerolineales bacterium]
MIKIWRIIKYEYTRHVFQKRFIISLLSLPFAVIAMVVVALLVGMFMVDDDPVGYVDFSGVLTQPIPLEEKGSIFEPQIDFLPYQDQDQAHEALEIDEIQAYFIIPADYPESLDIRLIYRDQPDSSVQNQFIQFLRQNLDTLNQIDPQIRVRLEEGSQITMISLDGSREMQEDQWYLMFTPFIAGIMFIIVVMTSGGYLLQAVVEEKENRTMEIVITSVSPGQLMTGKIIGNIAIGLTQLVIWLIFGWLGIIVGVRFRPILQDFTLSTDYLVVLL